MPLPQALARFNRRVTNRIARPVAARVPPMANVVHRGRRTGDVHRTPVLAFGADGTWAIALTYGSDIDWLRNVMDAGSCAIERAGERIELTDPRVLRGPEGLRLIPAPVRAALRVVGADEVLVLTRVDG